MGLCVVVVAHSYSSSVVPWCTGRQRKRKATEAFPFFKLIKSSLATKSTIEALAGVSDSLMEHARHVDINSLPVVPPRTSRFKSRTVRPPQDPNFLTDLVRGTLIQYTGGCTPSGSAETMISSLSWVSRRCSMGLSSRAFGETILMDLMETRALRVASIYNLGFGR